MPAGPPALLVARSMAVADGVAMQDCRWERTAIARYLTQDGERVTAAADRSSHLVGLARGTRIYLGPGWTLRDDFGRLQDLLDCGVLVEAPWPAVLR